MKYKNLRDTQRKNINSYGSSSQLTSSYVLSVVPCTGDNLNPPVTSRSYTIGFPTLDYYFFGTVILRLIIIVPQGSSNISTP